MSASIGIKLANGEFYPVLVEGSTARRRIVLTTVHDGQQSVQIDLYRSAASTMADASYIGSLVVEDIAAKKKGEPSIELVLSYDGSESLSAEAVDLDDGGERQSLSVSLQALDQEHMYEMPDFELENESTPPAALYGDDAERAEPDRKGAPVAAVIAAVAALVIVLVVAAWLLFFRNGEGGTPPATPATTVAPATTTTIASVPTTTSTTTTTTTTTTTVPAPVAAAAPAPAPSKRARPKAPVWSYKIPATIPPEGIRYKIRWGDTLWDISEAFYRNPWLYPRIAAFNKIRNPDLIISGTYLRVPPKR